MSYHIGHPGCWMVIFRSISPVRIITLQPASLAVRTSAGRRAWREGYPSLLFPPPTRFIAVSPWSIPLGRSVDSLGCIIHASPTMTTMIGGRAGNRLRPSPLSPLASRSLFPSPLRSCSLPVSTVSREDERHVDRWHRLPTKFLGTVK